MSLTIPASSASTYAAYKVAHPALINLVDDVRDWLNRDEDTVSNNLIGSFMQKAADDAYKKLRIPPLERTIEVIVSSTNATKNELPIPGDFTELIRLAKKTAVNKYDIYNDRVEITSFDDEYAYKPNARYFTRKGTNLKLNPVLALAETYELHYYARGFSLDALTTDTSTEIYNWLRDDNEKAFLFGSLKYAHIYLGDLAAAGTYEKLFKDEIDSLNMEETRRLSRGANVKTIYTNALI
jgi:hypothetical protein